MSTDEHWAIAIWRWLKRLGPTLLQAVGTVWLSLQLAKDTSSGWWLIPALVFVGGTVFAVWGSNATRHVQIERDQLREELDSLTAPRNERVHFLLRGLMNDLSIDTVNHRASLFVASKDSSFLQIGRYSLNAELATTARLTHNAGQGIVAATWKEVALVQNHLPKRRDQWEKRSAGNMAYRKKSWPNCECSRAVMSANVSTELRVRPFVQSVC